MVRRRGKKKKGEEVEVNGCIQMQTFTKYNITDFHLYHRCTYLVAISTKPVLFNPETLTPKLHKCVVSKNRSHVFSFSRQAVIFPAVNQNNELTFRADVRSSSKSST